MNDIWSGAILLPDDQAIEEVGFASRTDASPPVISSTSLRFLATVHTACIPLYLAAGPSLDVWTTCEATQEWFASILLSKHPAATGSHVEDLRSEWWAHARTQSPIGILVGVPDQETEGEGGTDASKVTEILFYGTVATPTNRILPTPPSSSPENPYGEEEQLPELKVHALPLSSGLLNHTALQNTSSDFESHLETRPQFISNSNANGETTPTSPKRARDVFDEAAHRRKKARAKGGEGVAAAAARAQDTQKPYIHRKSLSSDTKGIPLPGSRPSSAQSAHPSPRILSRSPSVSSDTRPLSRKGTADGPSKRSHLSQVATVPIHPEEPTIESRNKEALSRVVMAAMRMHGLQQRKKPKSRRGSLAPGLEQDQPAEEITAEEASKDEEYKLIYHQTYKGAALALRKHMATKPLHTQPDRLGDVVEKLLAIFCTDPLAQPLPSDISVDPLATPGSKGKLGVPHTVQDRNSPFDLPSASRVKPSKASAEGQVSTGSPVSRRNQAAPREQ